MIGEKLYSFFITRRGWIPAGFLFLVVLILLFLPKITAILLAAFFTAYAVSPIVAFLNTRLKMHRILATVLILLFGALFITAVLFVVLPSLFAQLADAGKKLPALAVSLLNWVHEHAYEYGIDLNEYQNLTEEALLERVGMLIPAFDSLPHFIGVVFQKTFSFLSFLFYLLIYAVIFFFMSVRLPQLYQSIVGLFPPSRKDEFLEWMEKFDHVLSGFIRGQLTVCLVLGSLYAIGLTLIGLPSGGSLGVVIGLFCLVPYVGIITGFALSSLVALSAGGWLLALKVFLVFGVIQTLDAVAITPNIMGRRVGISPVFVIIALFAGAELAGFLGVLVAVPTFAILKLIVEYLVEKYKSSDLYRGENSPDVSARG